MTVRFVISPWLLLHLVIALFTVLAGNGNLWKTDSAFDVESIGELGTVLDNGYETYLLEIKTEELIDIKNMSPKKTLRASIKEAFTD